MADLIMRYGINPGERDKKGGRVPRPTYGSDYFHASHVLHQCKNCGAEIETPIEPAGSWDQRAAESHTCRK